MHVRVVGEARDVDDVSGWRACTFVKGKMVWQDALVSKCVAFSFSLLTYLLSIAVLLLDCSKSSRQCSSLSYLLTRASFFTYPLLALQYRAESATRGCSGVLLSSLHHNVSKRRLMHCMGPPPSPWRQGLSPSGGP